MSKAQLVEVRKQLKASLGYSMTSSLFTAILKALEDDEAVHPLFDEYFDCSLKHFGVKPLAK